MTDDDEDEELSDEELSDEAKVARIESVYDHYRQAFPAVKRISANDVAAGLSSGHGLILVDVRKPEERAVSMIPGAITSEEFEARRAHLAGRTVVTYCTIGKRSGRYAAQLVAEGWDALNFGGSILEWTHSGGPLVHNDEPVRRLHVYGAKWNLAASGYDTQW